VPKWVFGRHARRFEALWDCGREVQTVDTTATGTASFQQPCLESGRGGVQRAAGGVQEECSGSVGSGLHRLELHRNASDAWWS
jgi:hypothetical protein